MIECMDFWTLLLLPIFATLLCWELGPIQSDTDKSVQIEQAIFAHTIRFMKIHSTQTLAIDINYN